MPTHYWRCLLGTSPPSSLPSAPSHAHILLRNQNQTLPESSKVSFLGLGSLHLLLPRCSGLKTSPLRPYSPLSASGKHIPLPAHFITGSRRQSNQHTMLKHLSCCKISSFIPKLATPVQWTAISWNYIHQNSSHSGLRWQTGQKQAQVVLTTKGRSHHRAVSRLGMHRWASVPSFFFKVTREGTRGSLVYSQLDNEHRNPHTVRLNAVQRLAPKSEVTEASCLCGAEGSRGTRMPSKKTAWSWVMGNEKPGSQRAQWKGLARRLAHCIQGGQSSLETAYMSCCSLRAAPTLGTKVTCHIPTALSARGGRNSDVERYPMSRVIEKIPTWDHKERRDFNTACKFLQQGR